MYKLTLDGVDIMGERLAEEVGSIFQIITNYFASSDPLLVLVNPFLGFDLKVNFNYSSNNLIIQSTFVMLAHQVVEVINRRPEARKISFIAHSVGGLVVRYAIGRLYRPSRRKAGEDLSRGVSDDISRGTICGLEAMNFITVATPHLGSRGNKQVFSLSFS